MLPAVPRPSTANSKKRSASGNAFRCDARWVASVLNPSYPPRPAKRSEPDPISRVPSDNKPASHLRLFTLHLTNSPSHSLLFSSHLYQRVA